MTPSAHDEANSSSERNDSSQKKGRPTPKRKVAEAKLRVNSLSPATTREAKKEQRELMKARRLEARAAYMRGEESALPIRDRGPAKKFVRNYIDSRRSIGEYFIPIMIFIIIMSGIHSTVIQGIAQIFVFAFVIYSVFSGLWIARKIKKEVAARFPNESLKGLGLYGWIRSTQMRRMRAPAPQVKRGDSF